METSLDGKLQLLYFYILTIHKTIRVFVLRVWAQQRQNS